MATQVQFRRGTTAEHTGFKGADGEVTVDTSLKTVVIISYVVHQEQIRLLLLPCFCANIYKPR